MVATDNDLVVISELRVQRYREFTYPPNILKKKFQKSALFLLSDLI